MRCPICDTLVVLEDARPPSAPPPESKPLVPKWLENLGLFVAFVASVYVWVRIEVSKIEPVKITPLPPMPRLPEMVTHPDASPDECARVRAIGGECVSYSTLRTCDDAGVMTEQKCGLGGWPCVRDGCGPGARCCVPGTFDAAAAGD